MVTLLGYLYINRHELFPNATFSRYLSNFGNLTLFDQDLPTANWVMHLVTGAFDISRDDSVSVSHLSAAFGLPEVCVELIELLPEPGFERAWLQYCELYNAPAAEQKAALGEELRNLNLQQGHARLTAFAAHRRKDAKLAARAWQEFNEGLAGYGPGQKFTTQRIEPPAVLAAVDEGPGISTNSSAQWGLAGIVCLAYTRFK